MNIEDARERRKQGARTPTEVSSSTLSPSIPAVESVARSQKYGCSQEGGRVRLFFVLAPGPVLAAAVVMAFGQVEMPPIPVASLRLLHLPP